MELTDLERNMDTGKVDHPDGHSKDKVDAVCGAIYHASQYAEEFAYDYGESAEKLLQWNSTNMLDNRNVYDVEMEKELMRIGRNCLPPKPVGFDEGREDYNLFTDIILI